MKTLYLTFILRLRLDDWQSEAAAGDKVFGSIQQVGQPEVFYFDSPEKFQETLQQLAAGLSIKEMKRRINHGFTNRR
jgi:hypothetical protein